VIFRTLGVIFRTLGVIFGTLGVIFGTLGRKTGGDAVCILPDQKIRGPVAVPVDHPAPDETKTTPPERRRHVDSGES
jgi:hypothetical protein